MSIPTENPADGSGAATTPTGPAIIDPHAATGRAAPAGHNGDVEAVIAAQW